MQSEVETRRISCPRNFMLVNYLNYVRFWCTILREVITKGVHMFNSFAKLLVILLMLVSSSSYAETILGTTGFTSTQTGNFLVLEEGLLYYNTTYVNKYYYNYINDTYVKNSGQSTSNGKEIYIDYIRDWCSPY